GEGDCGACTVVLGERTLAADGTPGVAYHAINACIRLAHSIDGMALWTVEDLAADPLLQGPGTADARALHPVQEALVQCHASQCGFCTPGFAMSLFGMYQNRICRGETVTRAVAQEDLSGNLCRCTGYRPILEAAERMAALPAVTVDEAALLRKLEQIAPAAPAPEHDFAYESPPTLAALLQARADRPQAQLVAGCTDVGLWVTKQHRRFDAVLDVTRAAELRRIERTAAGLRIGAAATLQDAYAALAADRPQLRAFAARFAGLPVRNSGTLGGNVANGSPIGDSMPLLIALGAQVVLASVRGERAMPLENLYLAYRRTAMAADEIVAWIDVPAPTAGERMAVYKVSKRMDDDISAVCLALRLELADDGTVRSASVGAGGVAATPVRARATEAALAGRPWTAATAAAAGAVLQDEFQPISDMRASAAYRRAVLGNLLQRFWLEGEGLQQVSLATLVLDEELA
uniref:xanthine dehydrogenase small subunit n=1 Tax=uncultured Xylophilus sp. TaxID=296832 RepID=UPI0025F81551